MNNHLRAGWSWRVLVAVLSAMALLGLVGAGTAEADHEPDWWDGSWCVWVPDHDFCHPGNLGESGGPVEEQFAAAGPWAVTTSTASAPGTPDVYLAYPTNLGADGYDHPILTWGNGTTDVANPCQAYEEIGANIISHLASWGYVVVCPQSGSTGAGTEMLAAAQWLVGQDSNANSVFFDKLDTSKVGSIGHSQGADGAVNAMNASNGVITSSIALALVVEVVHFWPLPDFGQVQDPLLLASGTADFLVNEEEQKRHFDAVPGPAAKAAAVGANHPGTMEASLGYATAWFKYTLEGDQTARSAFAGDSPEIASNSSWTNWAGKNLP